MGTFIITTIVAKLMIGTAVCNKVEKSINKIAEKEIERQRREGWFE